MAKHKVYKTNPLRKYIILSLFIFLFIGMGYSVLSTSLGIGGNITVWKHDQTLYGVLEYEARKGTYAKKYTGEHQDSMDSSLSNKDIYHWYVSNSTISTQLKDKWNVIFANHCWQMLRTTDTGGVKLLYNGEAENNQCLDARANHAGYNSIISTSLSNTYYYGTSYIYDSTNNTFSLDGTITTGEIKEGEYTCRNTSSLASCSVLYYVDYEDNGLYNVITLKGNVSYYEFGKINLKDNSSYSLANAGYMYNKYYNFNSKYNVESVLYNAATSNSTSYYYADSYSYDVNTNRYSLIDPFTLSNKDDYASLIGKYTFNSSSSSYTSSLIDYIVDANNNYYYYINLKNGNSYNYYNDTYTYGTSYVDNGDGTYTIENSSTIDRIGWYANYTNMGTNKYICKNATNSICNDLWYVYSANGIKFYYFNISDEYKFSNTFTYDSYNSTYVLGNNSVSFWNLSDSSNQNSLKNAHYTCWNSSGSCSTLSYVYYLSDNTIYYIDLNNGESITDAINNMLYVNTIDSPFKRVVDAWYKLYLNNYSNYIEDTIFCNDRSISNFDTTGWNINGGDLTKNISFSKSNGLICQNNTDKFSINNPLARLTYPVGLLYYKEVTIMGTYYDIFNTPGAKWYWVMTPASLNADSLSMYVLGSGSLSGISVTSCGIRPVISLKPGTLYSSGDGSMANPYVVSTN